MTLRLRLLRVDPRAAELAAGREKLRLAVSRVGIMRKMPG